MLTDSGNFGTLDTFRPEVDSKKHAWFQWRPKRYNIRGIAGAHNVMNMVVSPVGKGLFHNPIPSVAG